MFENIFGGSSRKKLDTSLTAIAGNVAFSKKDMYAFYKVPGVSDYFSSNYDRKEIAADLGSALYALVPNEESQQEVEGHLILTNNPLDLDAWERQVLEKSEDWNKTSEYGLEDLIHAQKTHMKFARYHKKEIYLGINLGRRNALSDAEEFFEMGAKEALDTIKSWASTVLAINSNEIPAEQEKMAKVIEERYYTILSKGAMRCTRASSEEILMLAKKLYYPSMPTPYIEVDNHERINSGDIAVETTGYIKDHLKYLEIKHVINGKIRTGYRNTLTVTNIPKFTAYPYGGSNLFEALRDQYRQINATSKYYVDYSAYVRFKLIPAGKMRKELTKKRKNLDDAVNNIERANASGSSYTMSQMPIELTGTEETLNLLEEQLENDKKPWFKGVIRVVNESEDVDSLLSAYSSLRQSMSSSGYRVELSTGDQLSLFLEHMPADYWREKSNFLKTNLNAFSTTGFTVSSSIGDDVQG